MGDIFYTIAYAILLCFAIVGFLFIYLKGYDYYLIKKEIRLRKGIGGFPSSEVWKNVIKDKCFKWVLDMPQVQVSDNMSFVLLEKITGKYSKTVLQAWQRGGLLLGIGQYLKVHPKETDTLFVVDCVMKDLFDKNFNWRVNPDNIDYAILAYAVMKLPNYQNHYYKAMEKIVEVIKGHIGIDGTVCYRRQIPNYRLVDTLGMVCPFLIKFGYTYDKPELIDLALEQIYKFIKYGVHPTTNIPAHAYHINSKVPLGIYGWGRGVGWYMFGLIDSYEELRQGHPRKSLIRDNILPLAEMIIKYQRTDGGWGHAFPVDHNQYDSSATAMSIYFLKKALARKIINGELYIKAIEKGIMRLKTSTRKDGTVDFSQGDTKDIGIYSGLFSEFPFTQGITLGALNMD